jgi:hypothetical protein
MGPLRSYLLVRAGVTVHGSKTTNSEGRELTMEEALAGAFESIKKAEPGWSAILTEEITFATLFPEKKRLWDRYMDIKRVIIVMTEVWNK